MSTMCSIDKLQKEIDDCNVNISQKQSDLEMLKNQLSAVDTWSTKVKNGNIRTQMSKIQATITELQKIVNTMVESLELQKSKRKQFDEFLKPIIDAGYIVYDDGEKAYTAQQLKFLKDHNNISRGCCLHNPELFENAEIYFASRGYSLGSDIFPKTVTFKQKKGESGPSYVFNLWRPEYPENVSEVFPGNPSLLSSKYVEYINKTYTDLRNCCFGGERKLNVVYTRAPTMSFT